MTLVLASQSASRKAMLEAAGVAFEAVPAALDERAFERGLADRGAAAVAIALAQAKALAVASQRPDALILGSDSLVEVNGRRFDKPRSRDEAADHLRFFSGRKMHLHSGAALVRDGQALWTGGAVASLGVATLSSRFIEWYLDREWPAVSGCVGVFRIEALGVRLFETIEGDQFTVLGMPLLKVLAALRAMGEIA